MKHAMRHLEEHGHPRQQLIQTAYHNRSLCLYAKLGFVATDMVSNMTGGSVDAEVPGRTVRDFVSTGSSRSWTPIRPSRRRSRRRTDLLPGHPEGVAPRSGALVTKPW